jgi:ABC-type cobalamin/Fe3+-siderophores transport system ATPase subunit
MHVHLFMNTSTKPFESGYAVIYDHAMRRWRQVDIESALLSLPWAFSAPPHGTVYELILLERTSQGTVKLEVKSIN